MKKIIFLFLVAVVLTLSGCSKSFDFEADQDSKEFGNTYTPQPTEDTYKNDNDPEIDDEPSQIAEQVVYDDSGYKITITGFDQSSGLDITLLIENNSDASIVVIPEYCIVNGYTVDASMYTEIAPGKKANDSVSISETSVNLSGIGKFTDIQLSFIIQDDSWDTLLTTGPINLETSNSGKYTQEYDDSGSIIYQDDHVNIVSQGLLEYSSGAPDLIVYMYNGYDFPIMVQTRDFSANGFMVDVGFSPVIQPKTHMVDTISLFESSLEDNGIDSVTDMEFSVVIYNETEFEVITESEPVALSVQ